MLAKIRIYQNGNGQYLPKSVDLQKFSEEQIRERLVDLGLSYNISLNVVGFEDWGVDVVMSLSEAYLLKEVLQKFYDGDAFIIQFLLKKNVPVMEVITVFYRFVSCDEVVLLKKLFSDYDTSEIINLWYQFGSVANAITWYSEEGLVLNTEKGFYLKVE